MGHRAEIGTTDAPLVGNEACSVYANASDLAVAVVGEILSMSYGLHLGPKGRAFFDAAFRDVVGARRTQRLHDAFAEARAAFAATDLPRLRRTYKTGSLKRSALIAGLDGFSGRLVDVGAGDNALGAVLRDVTGGRVETVGVDLAISADGVRAGEGLEFRVLETLDELPLESQTADACLFRFSLHHMEYAVQAALIRDAFRVLRPGGRVVIFEDAASDKATPVVDNALHRRVLETIAQTGQAEILSLLDASSCLVEDETMPFPFTFRWLEEWVSLLSAAGGTEVHARYWGVPMFSLFQAPLSVLTAVAP